MNTAFEFVDEVQQGTPEWLALRKTKITATDAGVIMGVSPWKNKVQLYHEKLSNDPPAPPNERMQRGLDLEPVARALFNLDKQSKMVPRVIIKEWAMASLDGIDEWNDVLEIKCPGEKDHSLALSGKIPDHYYPQLQHQMYVCGAEKAYYYSFDGFEGCTVDIWRDDEYIEKMLIEEKAFYDCMINKTPPEPDESGYIERSDDVWERCAANWIRLNAKLKDLLKEEEELRKQLVFLSGESNTTGAGISLCQIQRKGHVDYSKVPQLKGVDLEPYRKGSSSSWRITCLS